MLVDDVQFQNMFEMYKSEMHCQVLVIVMDKTVWEQPLCVTEPTNYTKLSKKIIRQSRRFSKLKPL